jgi:hypothetical protein
VTAVFNVGRATVTWYAPDGTVWPLTSPSTGWFTPPGVAGMGAIPISIKKDDNPRGGTRNRYTRILSRTITWPLQVSGGTHLEFVTRWRNLMNAFCCTQELGPGVLEVARPDGSIRSILAFYESGFDTDDPYATDGKCALSLYCEDPAFYGSPNIFQQWEYVDPTPVNFLDPFPQVSTSQDFSGGATIVNTGDVIAWPTWTINGPATSITATLNQTGESWTLDPSLIGETFEAGDVITITTNPPSVRMVPNLLTVPQKWTGALNWPNVVLWGIPKGSNDVQFTFEDADETTKIRVEFPPLYRTA